jgi:hypothetical protein
MSENNWEVIGEVAGDLQAEMLRGLLEAQGIKVWLSQEGAGNAYGLTLSTLGSVQILVPSESADSARLLMDNYYAGFYEEEDLQPESPGLEANESKKDHPGDETPDSEPDAQG